jgi:hypothetical protein
VTGGWAGNEPSNNAYMFEGANNRLIALPNMMSKRANHSSLKHNEFLFLSGGNSNVGIECFDTKRYKWSLIGSLLLEREFPILHFQSKYLYTFFGQSSKGGYTDTIERIDISGKEGSHFVKYSKEADFDLKLLGAATIELGPDSILIVGGKYYDDYNRTNIFQYDFSEKRFDSFKYDIESDVCFPESKLIKLKDGNFSNFNKVDHNLFKIIIEGE